MWWIIGSVVLVVIVAMFVNEFRKSLKDPDVIEASNLQMPINHYKIYKKILEEQQECIRNHKHIPDRTNEIPNMNEFRRYGDYQLKKSVESSTDDMFK